MSNTKEFELVNKEVPGSALQNVILVFALDRTSVQSISIEGNTVPFEKLSTLVFELSLPKLIESKDSILIHVSYSGEPPRISREIWFVEDERFDKMKQKTEEQPEGAIAPPEDHEEAVWTLLDRKTALGRAKKLTAKQSFIDREAAIRGLVSPKGEEDLTPMHLFFLSLDRQTHPILLEEEGCGHGALFQTFTNDLLDRSTMRGAMARLGLRFEPSENLDEKGDVAARMAELILRKALAPHCITADGHLDADKIFLFFRRFVDGKLFIKKPDERLGAHGAPNGLFFLCFTELMFYIRDNLGSECWNFWKDAVRPFVIVTDVFIHNYWLGGKRDRGGYEFDPKNFVEFTEKKWRNLARVYRRYKYLHLIEERFGDLCTLAFRDSDGVNLVKDTFIAEGYRMRTDRLPELDLACNVKGIFASNDGKVLLEIRNNELRQFVDDLYDESMKVDGFLATDASNPEDKIHQQLIQAAFRPNLGTCFVIDTNEIKMSADGKRQRPGNGWIESNSPVVFCQIFHRGTHERMGYFGLMRIPIK